MCADSTIFEINDANLLGCEASTALGGGFAPDASVAMLNQSSFVLTDLNLSSCAL